MEKTHLLGSYPFSGSSGTGDLQLCTVMTLLWEQETQDYAECRGTTRRNGGPHQTAYTSSCTWLRRRNRFFRSFLKTSLHRTTWLAASICLLVTWTLVYLVWLNVGNGIGVNWYLHSLQAQLESPVWVVLLVLPRFESPVWVVLLVWPRSHYPVLGTIRGSSLLSGVHVRQTFL